MLCAQVPAHLKTTRKTTNESLKDRTAAKRKGEEEHFCDHRSKKVPIITDQPKTATSGILGDEHILTDVLFNGDASRKVTAKTSNIDIIPAAVKNMASNVAVESIGNNEEEWEEELEIVGIAQRCV